MGDAEEAELDRARQRAVEQRREKVDSFLRSSNFEDALKASLENAPIGTSNQNIKDENTAVVLSALTGAMRGLGEKGMEGVVKGLSSDQVDILSKYIYRGLSESSNDSSLLLKTANIVTRTRGLGSIARTLSDRGTV